MKNGKNGSSKKKNKVKVDFTGVETRARIDDGQYHAKVEEITQEEGDKATYLKWVFSIVSDDKTNGRKLFYNTSLAPQALWNLRNLLETLGVDTPNSETSLDLDEYIGLELMVRVENEVYEGKERPKVTDFTPIEETTEVEADDEDEDEEEEASSEEEEEEEDEEEEDEEEEANGKLSADEVREMDESELSSLIKQHKLKVDLSKFPKKSKKISAVIDALEAKELLAE